MSDIRDAIEKLEDYAKMRLDDGRCSSFYIRMQKNCAPLGFSDLPVGWWAVTVDDMRDDVAAKAPTLAEAIWKSLALASLPRPAPSTEEET